jgi:uncharacterized membrane protein YphA (DoxX/SURF4 family)
MTKKNRIIYWIATVWLAVGMLSTAIVQLLRTKEEAEMMTRLGYPLYFLTIIGVWKILGVVAILIPGFPILKEWAYAGFFIAMSGAILSHLWVGDEIKAIFGPSLLLVLAMVSWYYRPVGRKLVFIHQ